MVVSVKTYEQVALEDSDEQWELARGVLRKKPGMTVEHDYVGMMLAGQLHRQLRADAYLISSNAVRLRVSTGSFYVPDLCVIPRAIIQRAKRERARALDVFEEPLPLVVEIWSPSTGDYDVTTKLEEYRLRGDAEVWLIHPYDKTLTAWRRAADGTYGVAVYEHGTVAALALAGVAIDLPALFE